MPIIGLTHEKDGRIRTSRTVTTKIAIGLPPDTNSNYPKKLDHFVFLQKTQQGKEIGWEVNQELQEHYGEKCKEFWIVFLDDDPDQVFRTEYAAFVKRGCWCKGDGEHAMRRDLGPKGDQWGELKVWNRPCANGGCQEFEEGKCKPSGDLYFMLADYPSLGSICRWHTSSYQSIREVYSALQDLRRVTGGRLMGVAAKLFVRAEKNVFEQNGKTMTGTKFVVGLELRASDMAGIQTKMLETAKVFNQIKGELNGTVLEIEEDEAERGAEISAEFGYTVNGGKLLAPEDPEKDLRAEADKLLLKHYPEMNAAKRQMQIGKYQGRMQELLAKLRQNGKETSVPSDTKPEERSGARAQSEAPRQNQHKTETVRESRPVENIHGLDVTDDDLPSNMFEDSPRREAAPTPINPTKSAPASGKAWSF